TIVRSTIVMKNETASTANARHRWAWGAGSVLIITFFASASVVAGALASSGLPAAAASPVAVFDGSDPAEDGDPSLAGPSPLGRSALVARNADSGIGKRLAAGGATESRQIAFGPMVQRVDPLASRPPAFEAGAATRVLKDVFGLEGVLSPLVGERYQNFR